jgi:hypothetical protein
VCVPYRNPLVAMLLQFYNLRQLWSPGVNFAI